MPKHIASRSSGRRQRSPRSRRGAAALIVIGLAAVLAAGLLVIHYRDARRMPTSAGAVPSAAAAPVGASTPNAPVSAPSRSSASTVASSAAAVGRPRRVRIDALNVDSRVVAVSTLPDGALDVPADPRVLGWWSGSALPGAAEGSVVIDGHVDSAKLGLGALFHLASLPMGSRVQVRTESGSVAYRVVARRVYAKADLPADVFATSGRPRLVLITCGGSFNSKTRSYRDNVVVYAVPV